VDGPSAHLSWAELACKDGTPYPEEWRQSRAVALAHLFEAIRTACGDVPLTVLSGYRTAAHNRRIGGAQKSQHVQGRALDLRPPKGWSVAKFATLIRDVHLTGGLGIYETFVHVDVRPNDRLTAWSGGTTRKDDTA
jgi:uncharacterized protein YcbK (DUF882 family)